MKCPYEETLKDYVELIEAGNRGIDDMIGKLEEFKKNRNERLKKVKELYGLDDKK